MKATVVFDFDGVIVDSIQLFSDAVNVAGQKLGRTTSFTPEHLRNIKRMSIPEICQAAGIEDKLSKTFIAEIDRELYHRADQYPIFSHMEEALSALSKIAKLSIVSATSQPVLSKVLNNTGLDHYFGHIIGGDMPGTKAVKIRQVLNDNGHSPHQGCFIGDTVSDIDHGQDAGVVTVAVSWGWHRIEWIRTAKPTFEVHCRPELIEIVEKWYLSNGSDVHFSAQTQL